MKRFTIVFVQAVILLTGIMALAILIGFPLTEGRAADLDLLSIYSDPFILYGYAASLAFFAALYKSFKLLGYIGQNKLISSDSVKTVRWIRYSAIVFSVLIVSAGMFIKFFHNKEDDPAGFLAVCFVTSSLSAVIGIAAGKFGKYLQNALTKNLKIAEQFRLRELF